MTTKKSKAWREMEESMEEAAKLAEAMAQDLREAIREAASEEDLRDQMNSFLEGAASDILSYLE